ncbi:hypothetical protein GINT2_001225 [Glugoides intestinalis]
MKISPKVTKTLEIGLYGAFIAYFIKIIATIVIGYVYLPPKYAGPVYYYWRKAYCDAEASKSSYTYIEPLMEDESTLFNIFYQTVQPQVNQKQLAAKIADLEEQVTKNANSSFSYYKNKAAKLNEKLTELKKKQDLAKTTGSGQSPLYSVGSFTDTFVLGPKKTFKIFSNGKGYDEKALQAELDFLAFRYVFLQYLTLNTKKEMIVKDKNKEIKPTKNYTILAEDKINTFFNNKNLLTSEKVKGFNDINSVVFTNISDSPKMFLSNDQLKAVERYISIYPEFNNLIAMLSSQKTKDAAPLIQFKNDQVIIDDSLLSQVEKIFKILEIETTGGSFREDFTSFIQRLSVVKPKAYDAHILNRFYYYYLFVKSNMDPSNGQRSDEKYTTLQNSIDEIHASLDELVKNTDSSSDDKIQEYVMKRDVLSDKLSKRRTELIFNNLSQMIAMQLGTKGHVLSSEEDDRIFLLKYFAYPGMFSVSQAESVSSVFQAPQAQN